LGPLGRLVHKVFLDRQGRLVHKATLAHQALLAPPDQRGRQGWQKSLQKRL
jgi:hypothetical protein